MGCKPARSRSPQAIYRHGPTILGNLFYISAFINDVIFNRAVTPHPAFPVRPMSARIVHFGTDSCSRLLVLEHAGYHVEHCPSVARLGFALTAGREADAVVITEDPKTPRREAITLIRSHSSAPLILFQTTGSGYNEADFDLVIPVLTPTREWLEKIAAAIERSRSVIANSRSVSEQSVRQRSKIDDLTRRHREKPAE